MRISQTFSAFYSTRVIWVYFSILVLRHCPAPFPQPPDSLKFLHSIFSVEIKTPLLYPMPSLHHVMKAHSMVSVESQCHQRSLCFCYQAGGWWGGCLWRGRGFRGEHFAEEGVPELWNISLADSISGQLQIVGICSDLKLIVHHAVFPFALQFGGLCLCFNVNGKGRYIVRHFYETIENNHNTYRSINSLEITPNRHRKISFPTNEIRSEERKEHFWIRSVAV